MSNYFSSGQRNVPIGLVLLYVMLLAMTTQGLQFRSVTHELSSDRYSKFLMDSRSYASPGLVYGTCTRNKNDKIIYDCKFALETNSKVGSLEHLRFCNFTYREKLDSDFSILVIDEDKAILSSWHPDSTNISVLHFSGCRVAPIDLGDVRSAEVHPALHGAFDVVSSPQDSLKYYRTLIVLRGNVMSRGQPQDLLSKKYEVMIQSPLQLRLAVDTTYHSGSQVQIALINYNGSTEVIKEYPVDAEYWKVKKYGISPTYELLSVCTVKHFTVFCGQFDLNGALKFDVNFALSESSKDYSLNSYNLPDGGMLVLFFKCYEDKRYSIISSCVKHTDDPYVVKKFDKNGRFVGSLPIWEFPLQSDNPAGNMHFFENEIKEMCLSQLDRRTGYKKNQVTLDVVCFTDEDLVL